MPRAAPLMRMDFGPVMDILSERLFGGDVKLREVMWLELKYELRLSVNWWTRCGSYVVASGGFAPALRQ
jgi:hypothetical protein